MTEIIFQNRIIDPNDWAFFVFVFAFVLIVITKTSFETRFSEFIRILFSDKFIKTYKDTSHLLSGFTILLFFVQIISFSFFILLLFHHYNLYSKSDWITFVRIASSLSVFVLSKYLIEKIIATILNIEEFVEQFNLKKVSYKSFIGLYLLPLDFYLFYTNNPSHFFIISTITVILAINLYFSFVTLQIYQNLLVNKLFYFILYLCTFEITPYYFIYYLITKKLI